MTRLIQLLALVALLTTSVPAEARPPRYRVVVRPPPPMGVVVHLGPWRADWRPAPRPGWVWVAGQYAPDGLWIPGHWEPAAPRPGYAWVAGHWVGEQWVEGYWREAARPGFQWIDGYYGPRGTWVPGYWQPIGPPGPPPGPPPAPAPGVDAPGPVAPGEAPVEEAPLVDPSGGLHHDYE